MEQQDFNKAMQAMAEMINNNVGNRITAEVGTGMYQLISNTFAPFVKEDKKDAE